MKNPMILFLLICFTILFQNCNKQESVSNKNKVSFQVDSVRRYDSSYISFQLDSIKMYDASNFDKSLNTLSNSTDGLFDYIKEVEKLINNPKYNNFNELRTQKDNAIHSISYRQQNEKFRKETEQAISAGTLPNKYLYSAYSGLCKYYTLVYELEEANNYFRLIKEKFPDSKDECISIQGKCVQDILEKTDSLEQHLEFEEDILYEKIKLKKKLIDCGCWFTSELMPDYSMVYTDLNLFLSKYPNSSWADNCAFWKIDIDYMAEGEGSYSIGEVNAIKKFITDYPNSELMADAKIRLAGVYSLRYDGDADDITQSLDKAIAILKDVAKKYELSDTKFHKDIESLIRDYDQKKNGLTFKTYLKSRSNRYNREDDVIIDVTIENMTSKSQKLKLYANSPFLTYVKASDFVEFIPSSVDTTMIDYIFEPHGNLKKTIILTKNTRIFGNKDQVGKYNFLKGAYHYFNIGTVDKKINKQIEFHVK